MAGRTERNKADIKLNYVAQYILVEKGFICFKRE